MPVEGEPSAVSVRVEEALPPAGTVTGLGRLTEMPFGATPVQAADRVSVELNPFTEEYTIEVDFERSGVKVIVAGEGWLRKSGSGEERMVGAVPAGVTVTESAALCVRPVGLLPIMMNGNVPVETVSSRIIVTVDALVTPAAVAIWLGPLPLKVAATPEGPE